MAVPEGVHVSRRLVVLLSAPALLLSLSVWQPSFAATGGSGASRAGAGAELSTSTRLADRREVAAGTRAYSIGFEDGRFYANGWHITGEMGGVWTPPVKLLDGIWFGLDGQWVGPATTFTSGQGYTRYTLPDTAGLQVERTDVVPDGRRGVLYALKVTNPGAARTASLSVDAHSELMGQFPWGFSGLTPNASENLPDKGSFTGRALQFTDDGALSQGPAHHYAALVGTSMTPTSGAIGEQYWGPQAGHRCTGTEPGAPADPKPSACDDGPFGNGTGGELTYALNLPAGGSTTVWVGRRRLGPGRVRREVRAGPHAEQPGPGTGPQDRRPAEARRPDQAVAPRRPDAAAGHRLGQAEHRRPDPERAEPEDPLDQPGAAVPRAVRHGQERHLDRRRLSRLSLGLRDRCGVHRVRGRRRSVSSARSRITCARCSRSPTC